MPPCSAKSSSSCGAAGSGPSWPAWASALGIAIGKRSQVWVVPGEIRLASENLINCDFQAAVSNEKWLTDITEFQIPAGKVYSRPADQRGIFFVVAATGTFE